MADFEEVYDLYFRDVDQYALSLSKNEAIAEEITQETFFKALRHLDRFDGRCKLYVWLCQIAKNTYFSLCRKERYVDRNVSPDLRRAVLSPGGTLIQTRPLAARSTLILRPS